MAGKYRGLLYQRSDSPLAKCGFFKRRPEKYLDPEIRNGISSFTAFSDHDELKSGLIQLEKDIASGEIADIMKKYENDIGDYIFYVAGKN